MRLKRGKLIGNFCIGPLGDALEFHLQIGAFRWKPICFWNQGLWEIGYWTMKLDGCGRYPAIPGPKHIGFNLNAPIFKWNSRASPGGPIQKFPTSLPLFSLILSPNVLTIIYTTQKIIGENYHEETPLNRRLKHNTVRISRYKGCQKPNSF